MKDQIKHLKLAQARSEGEITEIINELETIYIQFLAAYLNQDQYIPGNGIKIMRRIDSIFYETNRLKENLDKWKTEVASGTDRLKEICK